MNRKFVIAAALTLILSCSLVLMFSIPVAEAGATVYIRVDGSIDPSWANITSVDNVTYTLIGNVNDSVVVQRANIVVDGVGYTVQGVGSGAGINVTGVSNVTIKNCIIKSFRVGIYLDVGADNGRVENITIQNLQGAQGEDAVGINLKSNYNTIYNNTIANLTGGIGNGGGYSQPGASGGVSTGIYLSSSAGNNLTTNTIANLTGGTGGTGGDMASGGAGGTATGIYLSGSTNNSLTLNAMSNLTGGTGGTGGYSSSSGAKGASYSLYLYQSSSMTIKENTLQTADYCFYLNSSNNNIIYHNNINATTNQVYNYASNNTWDNGYPSGGNYWSNYTGVDNYHGPYENETGSDGIGDAPYAIDENNQDNYPFMKPYPWSSHDIGITGITTSRTIVGQGFNLSINTTIFNYGDNTETINVTVYCNETAITLRSGENYTTVTLTSGESRTVAIAWNTSGFAKGNYTIWAYAWPVLGETDTADNNFTGGWVLVTIPGDLKVSLADLVILAIAYGSRPGDTGWNPNADIDGNNVVGLSDLVILANHYGQQFP